MPFDHDSFNTVCAVYLFCGAGNTDLNHMVSSDHTVKENLALLNTVPALNIAIMNEPISSFTLSAPPLYICYRML